MSGPILPGIFLFFCGVPSAMKSGDVHDVMSDALSDSVRPDGEVLISERHELSRYSAIGEVRQSHFDMASGPSTFSVT